MTPAVLYILLLVGAMVPGLPLGIALFGRRHAAAWIAGPLFGYAITTLAVWATIEAGRPTLAAAAVAWVVALALATLVGRWLGEPLVALPAWRSADTRALLLVLLLVPVLMWRPLSRLGSHDAAGNRLYRAYFTADFVWHTALTAELARQEPRPTNPFLAPEPIHYYWTYFRIPASIAAHAGTDVQQALKINAVATALLLLSTIYLAAWTALPDRPRLTAIAVSLTVVASSAEGLASIADLIYLRQPLSGLRDLNVDAVAAWAFKSLRIDNLPRAFWYTPQHSFSLALGALAIPLALAAGVRSSAAAILLTGCALGASVAFNPFLGAAFCAIYGLTVAIDAWRTRALMQVFRHALAVVPVLAALGWILWNQVADDAGSTIHFGFWGPARNAPLVNIALQFGPILIPIAAALAFRCTQPLAKVGPALVGVVLALLVMHLVTLELDAAWVGFRGGQIFFVCAPAIVARGVLALIERGPARLAPLIVALVLASGLPTTVIDAYNAQDVTNRNMSPGNEFHWTVRISKDEEAALAWIRDNTPRDAVVQTEPTIRGRETWSLIPSFAERRMAAGYAVGLIRLPIYDERMARVKRIYESNDAPAAWADAKALGIDYLYVDAVERAAYPAVAKFAASPDYFTAVFTNAEAAVYAVRQ